MIFKKVLTSFAATGLLASFILWFTPHPFPRDALYAVWIAVAVLALCEAVESRNRKGAD